MVNILLIELTPDLDGMLPNTDTRYRTDQRMVEEGRLDEAEMEKQRLESKQRESRKFMEANSIRWIPRFFELKEGKWIFKNNYWENRGNFENTFDLFG